MGIITQPGAETSGYETSLLTEEEVPFQNECTSWKEKQGHVPGWERNLDRLCWRGRTAILPTDTILI